MAKGTDRSKFRILVEKLNKEMTFQNVFDINFLNISAIKYTQWPIKIFEHLSHLKHASDKI